MKKIFVAIGIVVIGVIIIGGFLLSRGFDFTETKNVPNPRDIIAIVNGEEITRGEFDFLFNQYYPDLDTRVSGVTERILGGNEITLVRTRSYSGLSEQEFKKGLKDSALIKEAKDKRSFLDYEINQRLFMAHVWDDVVQFIDSEFSEGMSEEMSFMLESLGQGGFSHYSHFEEEFNMMYSAVRADFESEAEFHAMLASRGMSEEYFYDFFRRRAMVDYWKVMSQVSVRWEEDFEYIDSEAIGAELRETADVQILI